MINIDTAPVGCGASVRATLEHDDPDEVFARIVDFTSYPDLCPDVVKVETSRGADPSQGVLISTWEVLFRGGRMVWTERDFIDSEARRCEFAQTFGDLELFEGTWTVTQARGPGAIEVAFECIFDIGVPSLADMLNPVAGRAITDNIRSMIAALFEGHDVRFD